MSLADYKGPANTPGIFRHLAGARVKACFQVGHLGKGADAGVDTYIVDESGCALVFHHQTGAYWRASKEDVDKQVAALRAEIRGKIAARQIRSWASTRSARALHDLYGIEGLGGEDQ
jgi:hypothetical protein